MSGVKTSLLDRMWRELAPTYAASRLRSKREFDVRAGGYEGAIDARFRNNVARRGLTFEGDEDRVIGPRDRANLRIEVSDMRRNLGLVFGLLNRFADYVVGKGLVPLPMTSSEDWNAEAADFWAQYMKVPDVRGRLTGWEIQRLTVKARLAAGESMLILRNNGQVQPVESERIVTPTSLAKHEGNGIIEGIQLTKSGRITAINVSPRNANGHVDKSRTERVRVGQFIRPTVYERFDQVRGVSGLAAIINKLRDKGELEKAILFKAKVDAFQGWAITSDDDIQSRNMDDLAVEQPTTNNDIRIERHDSGEFWYMERGDTIESMESKTPNGQYDSFSMGIFREIAMAVCLPVEVLLLMLGKSSFSGGRGIMMTAHHTFDIWQFWLVMDLLSKWWNWRTAMAMRDGVLSQAPVDKNGVSEFFRVSWIPPERTWFDPKAEAVANRSNVALGTESIGAILLSKGTTTKAKFREKGNDIIAAVDEADRVNKEKPGTDAIWTDIMDPADNGAADVVREMSEQDDKNEENETDED